MTQNDQAWARILQEFPAIADIRPGGHFDLEAKTLKAVGQREPRLMTKFDCASSVPTPLTALGLSVLPIRNGTYRIGRFSPFLNINIPKTPVTPVSFPDHILSLRPNNISSESALLDASLLSGIIPELCGGPVHLTVRGRRYSPQFNLQIGPNAFDVEGVQIEVDGGYESSNSLNLIEAKIGLVSTISIRQIAYPHASWIKWLNGSKELRSFLAVYSIPEIYFVPFLWKDGSIIPDCGRTRAFRFVLTDVSDPGHYPVDPEDGRINRTAPFPQADDFPKILALFQSLTSRSGVYIDDLFSDFDLVPRQYDYYFNALRWLGLAQKDGSGAITLTDYGASLSKISQKGILNEIAEVIFSDPIFNEFAKTGEVRSPEKAFQRWGINGTTIRRRLLTVKRWVEFFRNLIS